MTVSGRPAQAAYTGSTAILRGISPIFLRMTYFHPKLALGQLSRALLSCRFNPAAVCFAVVLMLAAMCLQARAGESSDGDNEPTSPGSSTESSEAKQRDQAEKAEVKRINRRIDDHVERKATDAERRKAQSAASSVATFFGMAASGHRVVYVLDRSGSMDDPGGLPMRAAKNELLRSIDGLEDIQQCYVIFYNQEPRLLNPIGVPGRLVFASEANKRSIARMVERLSPDGATDHMLALRKALALRPDLIFLLTDGDANDDLTDADLEKITRLNGGRAAMYVVQFGPEQAGNRLVSLAEQNRGKHKYVDLAGQKETAEGNR